MSIFESSVFSLVEPATVEEAVEEVLVSASGSSCNEAAIAVMRPRSQSVFPTVLRVMLSWSSLRADLANSQLVKKKSALLTQPFKLGREKKDCISNT